MAEERYWTLKCKKSSFVDRTAQNWQQTWESDNTVRLSKLKMIDFIYFNSYFPFLLLSMLGDLVLGFSMTLQSHDGSHMTQSQSCGHNRRI